MCTVRNHCHVYVSIIPCSINASATVHFSCILVFIKKCLDLNFVLKT
jgi:hypothetical protein